MYSFKSKIRYSEVDANCKLTWLALIDYFQDCSVFHSQSKNVGVEYLAKNNLAWVLSFWKIRCENMPKLADMVEIQTWPYDMKGFYGWRNFRMVDENADRLAYANSIWALIDTKEGHPTKITQPLIDAYPVEKETDMEYAGRKIKLPKEYSSEEHFIVPAYFIDSNLHMNNSKYVSTALCFVPDDFEIKELRAEYKRSAMLGDEIVPRVTRESDSITVVLTAIDGSEYAAVQFISV